MKKMMIAGALAVGIFSLPACDRTNNTTHKEGEKEGVVVDRDSVPSEYKVTETVVDYDTTTRTKTVDADKAKDKDRDDHKKKD